MYSDYRPPEQVIRLLAVIEAASAHLKRARELERQAIDLMRAAEAYRVRVTLQPHSQANDVRGGWLIASSRRFVCAALWGVDCSAMR
jgi:uncharacterized protein YhaN